MILRALFLAGFASATALVALLTFIGWVGHTTDSTRLNETDF